MKRKNKVSQTYRHIYSYTNQQEVLKSSLVGGPSV